MNSVEHTDASPVEGLIRIYSPKLIAELKRAGCRRIVDHPNGTVTFEKTPALREILSKHAAAGRCREVVPCGAV